MLSTARGFQGEDLVLLWTCDGGALRRALLGGVVFGVLVEVCLEVLPEVRLLHVAVNMQRVHGC
jgi:hypothetical protein